MSHSGHIHEAEEVRLSGRAFKDVRDGLKGEPGLGPDRRGTSAAGGVV